MARIFGLVFSGFVVRFIYAPILGLYLAATVWHYVAGVFASVNNALPM
jgi:hypothetical protein